MGSISEMNAGKRREHLLAPTKLIINDLLQQLNNIKVQHENKKRVKPVQLIGLQVGSQSRSFSEDTSQLQIKNSGARKTPKTEPSTSEYMLEVKGPFTPLIWIYLTVLRDRLGCASVNHLVIDGKKVLVSDLKEELSHIPLQIPKQQQDNISHNDTFYDSRMRKIAVDQAGNHQVQANRQRLRDTASEIILRIDPDTGTEMIKKKTRSLIDATLDANLEWLAEHLVERCSGIVRREGEVDRMSRLEGRLKPSIWPFEMSHGEQILCLMLQLTDSHRLSKAVVSFLRRQLDTGTKYLVFCVRVLLVLEPQVSFQVDPRWICQDAVRAIQACHCVNGSTPKISEDNVCSFALQALCEDLDTSFQAPTYSHSQLLGLSLSTAEAAIHALSCFSNSKIASIALRKVRPITISDEDRKELPTVPSAQKTSLQERLSHWFWWRYPKLRSFSECLVRQMLEKEECVDEISRDRAIRECLTAVSRAQGGVQWSSSSPNLLLLQTWINLTLQLKIN